MGENMRPSFQQIKDSVDNLINEIILSREIAVSQGNVENVAKKRRPNYVNVFPGFTIVKRGIESICESGYTNPLSVREMMSAVESTLFGKNSIQTLSSWLRVDDSPRQVIYILSPELSEFDTEFLNVNFLCRLNLIKEKTFYRELMLHLLCISNPEFLLNEYRTVHQGRAHLVSPVESLTELFTILENPIKEPMMTQEVVERKHMLMTSSDMAANRIPHPQSNPDYKQLCDFYYQIIDDSPIVSLDIEGINRPSRIAVVHESGEIIMDSFIIDHEEPRRDASYFIRRFSDDYDDDKMNKALFLHEVLQVLKLIVRNDTILLGHSLHGDLHTLKISHAFISDTSVLLNLSGNRHRKDALSTLSEEYLHGLIVPTHYPADDAKATLALAKLVLSEGLGFGNDFLKNSGRDIRSLGNSVIISSEETQEMFVQEWPEVAYNINFKTAKNVQEIEEAFVMTQKPIITVIDASTIMEPIAELIENLWMKVEGNTLFLIIRPSVENLPDTLLLGYKFVTAAAMDSHQSPCNVM